MLAAHQRLRRSDDFRRTVRRGSRSSRSTVVVHLLRDAGTERPAQAGFVVSRAVGGAVVRNGVQRRLRHLLRERLYRFPVGSLVVVRATPSSARASSADLGRDLDACLSRLVSS
ncbi:MAG: ribonuclease P protein component [Jiangellales bacterium]